MTTEEETLYQIKGMIASLPPRLEEATNELAEHLRTAIRVAGEPVGTMAMALVGAETQLKNSKEP